MATAVVTNYQTTKTAKIYQTDFPLVEIKPISHMSVITDVLPFRVKFTSIQIESLRTNIPAIPFQVIGYSNYIL